MILAGQYCSVLVNDLFLGIDLRCMQEVIRSQPMTRVPLASREVSGLINLRGQIVAAIDLRRRLGLPDRAPEASHTNVVIRTEDSAVSLLVDEIGDVLQVDPDTFEPPPETLDKSLRELIQGVHKLEDKLMLILDTKAVLSGIVTHAPIGTR